MSELKWSPTGSDYPGDQEADLQGGYWAEIGPSGQHAPECWSWTIILAGEDVAGGCVENEEAAKRAVAEYAANGW